MVFERRADNLLDTIDRFAADLGSSSAIIAEHLQGVELSPLVVVSGDPDSQVRPSHLAAQGFYLLRARTQLREISNVLLN